MTRPDQRRSAGRETDNETEDQKRVQISGGALGECTFQPDRMEAAVSSSMMATDLADYLVRKGATFREAHGAVGGLVLEVTIRRHLVRVCHRGRRQGDEPRADLRAYNMPKLLASKYKTPAKETET